MIDNGGDGGEGDDDDGHDVGELRSVNNFDLHFSGFVVGVCTLGFVLMHHSHAAAQLASYSLLQRSWRSNHTGGQRSTTEMSLVA